MITQINILLYLDERHILENMKKFCETYLEQLNEETIHNFSPLRYYLHIDVIDLLDFSPEIGLFLLREPLKWQHNANAILFTCLKSVDSVNKCFIEQIKFAQVAVIIRLRNIPSFLATPKENKYSGIVVCKGLLMDISKLSSYVYHSVWSCPEQCDGGEVILQYIPKTPPKCYVCRSVLFENSTLRRCGDQVTVTFQLKNELLCKKFTISDDLITVLKLGATYSIYATYLKKSVEVWYVEEINGLTPVISFPIPTDIKDLFSACEGVPWKFIYCLASSIGSNICPLNCFMNVKINLLLSLSSVKSHTLLGSNIVHVSAAGYDTGYIGKLMESASQLAERQISLGTSNTSTSTALLAASGGVCLMPLPFYVYSQKQHHSILSAIESNEILINNCKNPLKCAVWAHGKDFKKIDFCNVSNVFGNACRGDYDEFNDELSDHIIQQALDPKEMAEEEIKALKEVKYYLDITAGIKVTLDLEAERLLRSYFLAVRKERPKTVTLSGMSALVSVCMTSAKLCRRSVANRSDAVFAIWLHASGVPEPRFAPLEYLDTPGDIKKLQKVITQFQCWLEEFTGCF